ncbi:NADPH:quinone reductase [Halococcus sp. AFM35]|uniref:NADPH:quinone reductase n=1 Tax=Halococcus sp. AFM35 TaxID=3421653 RepID=UPI003EB870B0
MRAVRFHDHGGPEVLDIEEIDEPSPGAREVLVEVHAAGINPVDTYFREGAYDPFTLPMIPGTDFAGEVRETGEGVEGFAPDDRVYGTGIGRNHHGGYAECAAVPADRLVHLPDGVNTTTAGAAGVAGVTAWRALVDHAGLEPGETCLIHGGSGGVGHVAVQLAAATGAQVLTTASPDSHDRLAELGADAVFDYSRADLADAVGEAASGVGGTDGVDVVLDHRLDDYLQFDAAVAATGARVVGIGEQSPQVGFENDGVARSKDVNYQFMSMFNTPDFRVPLARLATLMSAGDLTIDIAREYELEGASEAQRAVLEESFLGKLVVVPDR